VALWLALMMLFGMFAPTGLVPGMGFVEVQAANAPDWDGLGAHLNLANQILKTDGGGPVVAYETPPDNSAFMYWMMGSPAGGGQLHVLRHFNFFNDEMHRIELTARTIDTTRMQVNFDIFQQVDLEGGSFFYRSVSDPEHHLPPASFMLYDPFDNLIPVDEYVNNLAIMELDDAIGRSVNIGQRFGAPVVVTTDESFSRVPLTFPSATPTAASLTHLTPSFVITRGTGFSFEYGGMRVHFMWEETPALESRFVVYFEGNEAPGQAQFLPGILYEFELEVYSTGAGGAGWTYHTSGLANAPWFSTTRNTSVWTGLPVAPGYVAPLSSKIYFFTGISNFYTIPFASAGGGLLNTLPANVLNYQQDGGPPGLPLIYSIEPLHLPSIEPAFTVAPVANPVGLDIRFTIPRMLDENAGFFSALPSERFEPGTAPRATLRIDSGTGTANNIFMDIILDIATMAVIPPTTPNTGPLEILDAPILIERAGVDATIVSIRVAGFEASKTVDSMLLRLDTPPGVGQGQSIVRSHSPEDFLNNEKTFLDFDIRDFGFGPRQIEIVPFSDSGWYRVRYGPNLAPGTWVQQMGPGNIFIPIGVGLPGGADGGPVQYQIEFSATPPVPGATGVLSQIVIYHPHVRPPNVGLPEDFTIVRYEHRPVLTNPRLEPNRNYGDLTLHLRWGLGTMQEIIRMLSEEPEIIIEYVIMESEVPLIELEDMYAPLVGVRVHLTSTGALGARIRYTLHPVTVVGANMVLGDNYHPDIELINDEEYAFEILGNQVAQVSIRTSTVRHGEPGDDLVRFNFPGVHFMYVRGIQWRAVGTTNNVPIPDAFRSREQSLTLSDMPRMNPPVPSDLRVSLLETPLVPGVTHREPGNPINAHPSLNVRFSIPRDGMQRYLESMHEFRPHVSMNLYITAFEESLVAIMEGTVQPDTIPSIVYDTSMDWAVDLSAYADVLRGATGNIPVVRITDIPLSVVDDTNAFLPNMFFGDVYALINTWNLIHGNVDPQIWLTLFGLDENRGFYLMTSMLVERFTPAETPDGPVITLRQFENDASFLVRGDEADVSVTSGIVAETTPGTPEIPDETEIDPTAPEWVRVQENSLEMTSVVIEWSPVAPLQSTTMEYEIIRVQGTPLTEAQMQTRVPDFAAFVASLNQPAKAWRTDGNTLLILTEDGFVTAPDYDYAYGPSVLQDPPPWLQDNTLTPNRVYFYYVRARQMGEDGQFTLSTWVGTPVTTTPVVGPTNLRLADPTNRLGFDPMFNEFVNFDVQFGGAPATVIAQLGVEFYFEIQFREDGGQWTPITRMDLLQLTNINNIRANPDGTMTFYYMLRGLRPGSMYEVRVRLYHIATGSASLWSNVLIFNTMGDTARDELERDADNWLEHLRRNLMDILRRPYWVAADSDELLRLVYRPNAFRGLIDGTLGTTIPLHNTDARQVIYYFPASGLLELNEARRGLHTAFEDIEVLFGPRFVSQDHNRAMLDMARVLNNRTVAVGDYFVRVSLQRQTVTEMLHGNEPLSDAVAVQVDLVGVSTPVIRTWDNRMQNQVEQHIEARVADALLRQNIINLIERDEFAGDRREYVLLDFMADVEASIEAEINRMITRDIPVEANNIGIIAQQIIPVVTFDAPVHVRATNATPAMTVNGFNQVRTATSVVWQQTPVTAQLDGHALITQAPGVFAFSKREVVILEIESIPQGQTITTLAARLDLDSLVQGNIDLHQNATRQVIAGSIARMAGASAGSNYVDWVANNMNVTLANRNAQGMVSQQEAVAMIMALYEQRTNTRVSAIMIRNQQSTAGMNLDNRYAQAVRAAFELNLINAYNFQPANPTTIGDLLDMLASLDARIGL